MSELPCFKEMQMFWQMTMVISSLIKKVTFKELKYLKFQRNCFLELLQLKDPNNAQSIKVNFKIFAEKMDGGTVCVCLSWMVLLKLPAVLLHDSCCL